jgi:hypothetical protein
MNAQNVATSGKKGGPRTVHTDNSHPVIKIALRQWIAEKFELPIVLDVYGGYGMMYESVWKVLAKEYLTSEGEAINWLDSQKRLGADIFDVDPYSSPYEALEMIGNKAIKKHIGIVCTDGCLRRQAHMRGHLTKFLEQKCGWDSSNKGLMAAIYYQYPSFLRFVLQKIMPEWKASSLAIKYGIGFGRQSTVYFACLMEKIQ